MSSKPRFYYYEPRTGEHVDITEPVGTDGLDLGPPITEDTEIQLRVPGYESKPMRIADSPWTPAEVQQIINRGGQIYP